jgi:putative transposase
MSTCAMFPGTSRRFIKRRVMPIQYFKANESAAATLAGIELAHMLRKGQLRTGNCALSLV